jgi:hypothetical protein
MDDIVWLQPKATYATVSAALALASGRKVALVFPSGDSTCLRDTASLTALHTRCQLLAKDAVIIGGDALLRARAVAAGFQAATTLDDWGETGPELYAVSPGRNEDGASRLWVVAPRVRPTMRATDLTDATDSPDSPDGWVSEPPDFVIEIHRTYGEQAPVAPRLMLGATVTEVDDASVDDDVSASDRSERFEEMVIGRILETSGLRHLEVPGAQ